MRVRPSLAALMIVVAGCGADAATDPGTSAAARAEIAFGYSFDGVVAHATLHLLGERQLTSLSADFSSDHTAIWSPDSQWILYEHWKPATAGRARCTTL